MEVRGVGVFALSNAPSAPLLAQGCARLSRALGGVPLRCLCQSVGGPRRLAGDDALRRDQFHALLEDPQANLLVAARGGFGVTRLLEQLDFPRLKASGKALCGYSDVSALLVAAWSQGCRRLLHGPMVCSSWAREDSPALATERESFLRALRGEWSLCPPGISLETLRPGVARGPLIPVNLTMLISLLGTPFQPDLQGAILLLEDVHEPAHAIERMLVQLRSAGILKRLAGLVLGQFSQGEDAEFLPELFQEVAQWVPGPVLSGYPLGHQHPSLTCPVGAIATLEARG
ncbi:MAG: LD-carboxypeptidase [Oligosphaeraceae bacterium]